jgi:diaminopimelate decarboxylase
MSGLHKFPLYPQTVGVNDQGHLCIAGCDAVSLSEQFGTPLYLIDEYTMRNHCREFKSEFSKYYRDTAVIYASKALLNRQVALLIAEEKVGLDVVSGGDLSIARSVNFPMDSVYFHGNNKTMQELKMALDFGVGTIVVDNFYELDLLDKLVTEHKSNQRVMLRITPGVDPHSHKYTSTGILDSKFGFPLSTGQAAEAVKKTMAVSGLNLVGLHFHLGSPLFEVEPYLMAIDLILQFAANMKQEQGFKLEELSIGGGFAVQYVLGIEAPSAADYAKAIAGRINSLGSKLELTPPNLIIEPGRAIVAQAGVALYSVGAIKNIPGVRKYICIDGGMSDNIRPALYGAKYEAIVANKVNNIENDLVTIVGKLCESGDILIKDTRLASMASGDLIAMPVCGAYSIPMSSNYNNALRPAIVMLNNGKAKLIRRRESYEDLIRLDEI